MYQALLQVLSLSYFRRAIEARDDNFPILQVRRLRLRLVKKPAQSHAALVKIPAWAGWLQSFCS
jgi:hypothetical protein